MPGGMCFELKGPMSAHQVKAEFGMLSEQERANIMAPKNSIGKRGIGEKKKRICLILTSKETTSYGCR